MLQLRWAKPIIKPPFPTAIPKKGLKRKGYEYEEKGHEIFLDRWGIHRYFPSQWFIFQKRNNQLGYCQTDGILFNPDQRSILILEFKFKHTPKAYYQLEQKYVPVMKKIFRGWSICVCEVVHWYDPQTNFPVPITLTPDPTIIKPNEFGVHILNP